MRYDESIVENVIASNDIVDIVGQYVRLTKKGANYFGLCPFHGEKTASFSVSERKQIFYCFGCGAGGNVISFLMKYENYTFAEALKSLADRAHIDLPEPDFKGGESRQREFVQKLYDANRDAAYFYVRMLGSEEGERALSYFSGQRRLSQSAIRHFGLGYAPGGDVLYRYLSDRGYTDDVLKESGLFNYNHARPRDRFFNRVMFPIMDTNNRVRGFGGRVMGEGEPKYLNSPESRIFDKSDLLYGLNFARKSRSKSILLCEGYMDVIALHQAGFSNSVASLGTALNERHARLLKRYTDNVILAQDSDEAGIKAKLRAYPILKNAGLDVKVLEIKGAKDPDEYIKKYGPDAFDSCISNARNAFLYMAEVRKREYDLSDPAGKTAFYNRIAEDLLMFEEPLERENYIDSVSRDFMIDKTMLTELVGKRAAAGHRYQPGSQGIRAPGTYGTADKPSAREKKEVPGYEKLLISWLLERPELSGCVFRYINPDQFATPIYRDAARVLSESRVPDINALMARYQDDEESLSDIASAFADNKYQEELESYSRAELERGLTEAVKAVKSAYIEKMTEECGDDLKALGKWLREKNELSRLSVSIDEKT